MKAVSFVLYLGLNICFLILRILNICFLYCLIARILQAELSTFNLRINSFCFFVCIVVDLIVNNFFNRDASCILT